MSGKNSRPDHAAELRRQAEELFQDNTAKSSKHFEALSPEETQHMLHELQVHQIELEMQNEELRQAQVELDAGRARYFDLYDLAPVGYVTTSEQGLLLEANLTTATLLGVTRNDLIKQLFSRFVLREDQDIYYFLHKQLFETGEPHGCELRMVKKDGTAFWVQLQATSVQDTAGPAVSRVVISDITERKQAEETSRENRRQLTDIIEFLPDATLAIDKEGRVIIWNKAIEKMTGIPAAEMIGKGDHACAVPFYGEARPQLMDLVFADREEIAARYPNITRQGNTVMAEVFCNALHNNEGAWVFAKASPLHDHSGNIIGAIESIRDITERKQAEGTLQNERLLLRTLIDNIPDSIYSKDLACRKTLANSTEVRYLGAKSEADVLGKNDFDIYPQELAEKFFADDQLVIQTGEPVLNREEYIFDKKQQKRWLLSSKLPLRNQDDRIIGLVGIGRDITDRKQAESQLRQSQKMEAVGTLAGGVAHDFNNLLTGILGNIALMRSSLPPTDPLLENLKAVETAARQAADLTRGLLTFGRSAMVLPAPMKIADALDAALAILKQSLPATMEIVRDYEQTTWNVLVDQSQMTQILFNLAVNARDAMKGKGTLTIRARNEVVGEEYLQTHPFARAGEFVHLSIRDTGPGMSSEAMQHLFEPFYTTKPVGSGTGLGLSIVYSAVKQAGGWVTADSPGDGGTIFDVFLPRCLQKPSAPGVPAGIAANVCSGTILVVEDEPVVCAVAQGLLTRSGCTVLTAVDGASALATFRKHQETIDLILLDMTMPGMTSGEIVHAIRALDPTVPILLNSGYTSNGAVKQMLEENSVQGFLGKPYELTELLSTINRLLKRD